MAAISHRLSQLKMFWKQVQQWVAKETEVVWVDKLDKKYKTSSLDSLIPRSLKGNLTICILFLFPILLQWHLHFLCSMHLKYAFIIMQHFISLLQTYFQLGICFLNICFIFNACRLGWLWVFSDGKVELISTENLASLF